MKLLERKYNLLVALSACLDCVIIETANCVGKELDASLVDESR